MWPDVYRSVQNYLHCILCGSTCNDTAITISHQIAPFPIREKVRKSRIFIGENNDRKQWCVFNLNSEIGRSAMLN